MTRPGKNPKAGQPGFKRSVPARAMMAAMTLALAPLAAAQDAGSALRESTVPSPAAPTAPAALPAQPAPAAAPRARSGTASFVLKSVSFVGNSVYSSEQLAALAADKIGQSVSFADLEAIAAHITEHYRKAGYFLAQAVLPVQDVSAGKVEFSIIEGSLGRLRVNRAPDAPISDERVQGYLDALQLGQPLSERELEQTMMILSDLPGVVVQSSLEAGNEAGTTDLVVDVNPRRRWDFMLDADNHGSRVNGEFRIGATGRINSPFTLGDNLDLRVLASSGGGLQFGRVAYELPVGYRGTRAGLAYSRVEYELGKEFAALGANGTADVYEANLTHPFIRARTRNLVGRLSVVEKVLEDRYDFNSTRSDKRIKSVNLGVAYEGRDGLNGGGYSSGSLTAGVGWLDIRSDADKVADQLRRTDGRFARLNYQFSRLQSLAPKSSLLLGVTGQMASRNLDSAEKIALGGPNAVRAYPVSEGIVDEGYVANIEYRYSLSDQLTVSGFYDAGWGSTARDPLPNESTHVALRGYGLGMFWGGPQGLTVRASMAWRDTARATSEPPDRVPRVFVQVLKPF